MTAQQCEQIEIDLWNLTSRNFMQPAQCRDLEQVRFYVRELCRKIDELDERFHYVPESAYTLLAQYNARQSDMLHARSQQPFTSYA